MGMEQFYTRDKANEGIKVPLHAPDGTKTEHWLLIRGVDSDEFRRAEAEAQRKLATFAADKDKSELEKIYDELFSGLRAHLVARWSFDKECTIEAVTELFKNAPQIADMANRIGGNRSLFFASKSSSLKSSPEQNSGSTVSHKDQSKAGEQP